MKYSCYYIIHLGCLWALLCTFILLLGLTYWPSAQCQFLFFSLFLSFTGKEYQTESNRSGDLPPQASVATKNQSGPCSGTLPEGGSLTGGHLHHPGALHDEEGVVHPRGWGYVPVAMCLISLSLSCSWGDTILMYRELCYYIWIL